MEYLMPMEAPPSPPPANLSDILRLGFPMLSSEEDAFCLALIDTACRDAMHELHPMQQASGGVWYRFPTSLIALVRSPNRLEWARTAFQLPWTARNCLVAAARIGQLDVCRALLPEVPPPRSAYTDHAPADACRAAAYGGHVHVLEWLRDKGFLWDASVCAAAAHAGDLPTLKWLLRRGCPWDKATTCRAAVEGHTAIVAFCRQHGCEYSEEAILRMKMAKLQLAMGRSMGRATGGAQGGGGAAGAEENARVSESGVIMVKRHAAQCW